VSAVIAPAESSVHPQPAAEFPLNLDLPLSAADDRLPDTIEMALVSGNTDEDMGDDVVSLEVDEQLERGLDLLLPDMDLELPASQLAEADGQEQASTGTPVIEIVEEALLTPAVAAAEPAPVVSRINPDTLLNFDFEFDSGAPADTKPMPALEPLAAAPEAPPLALDFGSISLDLGSQSSAGETRSEPEAIDLAMDDIASVDEDPIDIKISLARAYMDMGDRDSANEILQEVLDEGNATQGKLAREMLEDMRSAA
jgi:pilus assembly protein FimV